MPASRRNRPDIIPPSCVGDRWSQEARRRPRNQASRRPLSGPPPNRRRFRQGRVCDRSGLSEVPSPPAAISVFPSVKIHAWRIGVDRACLGLATGSYVAFSQRSGMVVRRANISSWPTGDPGGVTSTVRKAIYQVPQVAASSLQIVYAGAQQTIVAIPARSFRPIPKPRCRVSCPSSCKRN